MIDSHSHIYLPDFEADFEDVMLRAREAGVQSILMPAIDYASLQQMEKLRDEKIRFYKMVGIHPTDVDTISDTYEEELYNFAKSDDIYGIGETGLDYYWSTDKITEQKNSLEAHFNVAKALKKPIVLHNRNSTADLLAMVEEAQDGTLTGVWHCFNGTLDEGKKALDLGVHLGIGGVLTFKNAGVDKTVRQLPLDKMILETDAPYLAPTPKRGKRNEPAFMRYTAEKLAELFDLDIDKIDEITTKTTKKLFNLD